MSDVTKFRFILLVDAGGGAGFGLVFILIFVVGVGNNGFWI